MLKKVYLRWIIIYIHIHLHENNIIAEVLFPISHHFNELLRYFSDICTDFFKRCNRKVYIKYFFYIKASIFYKTYKRQSRLFFLLNKYKKGDTWVVCLSVEMRMHLKVKLVWTGDFVCLHFIYRNPNHFELCLLITYLRILNWLERE